MIRENQILHEREGFYAWSDRRVVYVMKPFGTAALTDSAFSDTEDGRSLAIARVNYLARRAKEGAPGNATANH